jgi:hypothetical protein
VSQKNNYSQVYDAMHSDPLGATLFVHAQEGRAALTPERRGELKTMLKEGRLDELRFDAVVFRDGPNANHTRFRQADLAAFAQSFVGVPFLRNHDTNDIGARDGTVVESRMVGSEFHQTIRLTTERGMRDFLEGVIDRFSIGWYFEGVECGTCGKDWFECSHWPGQRYEGCVCELMFVEPRGKETSAVNAPAVQGTRVIEQLCQLKRLPFEQVAKSNSASSSGTNHSDLNGGTIYKESRMPVEGNAIVLPDGTLKFVTPVPAQPDANAILLQAQQINGHIEARHVEELIMSSGLSDASKEAVRLASAGRDTLFVSQQIEAQRKVEASALEHGLVRGIRPITANQMQTPHEQVQSALSWVFGAREEPVPPPSMRGIRDLYQAITGDHNWHGVFNPEWSQLAGANTTTLAGMVVNALNKSVQMHFDNMATYRWYERIVDVVPHDGTTHDVQLIMVDGLANLPAVLEGAAYTEATVGDSKESFAFTKRGHYVGITLETFRKSDIQRIQAIPRAMVQASVRTRSAAIAAIFTANSGTGPTLADDSTALFHSNHGNLDTTAFGTAGWAAARSRIWEQTVPGTASPLGLWPTFVLVPIELYDSALTEFGYGTGDVGKPSSTGTAQTVNPYGDSRVGDPRPVPIPVPEWTDATDWAYMVDPRLHPVIHMGYADAPQGGQHPVPEIYQVTSESSGLLFTNDTLPVKIRDWWGYGVSTYIGIGKNNVAA